MKWKIDFESQNFAIFGNFYLTGRKPKNFLRDSLLVLRLKEGLVKCATVCVKSEVILFNVDVLLGYPTDTEYSNRQSVIDGPLSTLES